MAIVWRIITQSAGQSYDFQTGTLYPLADTWSISPPDGDGFVTETMELGARNASDANIIAAVKTLGQLAEKAERWQEDKYNTESVWYELSATSEGAKRAFVKTISILPIPRSRYTPMLGQNAAFYQLSITRLAAWELTGQSQNFVLTSGVSALSGNESIGAVAGEYPARIGLFSIGGNTMGGGSGSIYRAWAGIRPTHQGISNFNGLWELEDATLGTDSALATDATNASPFEGSDNIVTCTFGTTTTLVERVGMTVDQATASTDYDHFIGKYLILLRCKLSAAGTVGLQLRSGYANGSNFRAAVETYITNTDWRLIPVGEVSVPPGSYRSQMAESVTVKNFEIQIHAEQVSGTPSLSMDCLRLIPSEHMVQVERITIDDEYDSARWFTFEDGEQEFQFLRNSAAEPDVGAVGVFTNWNLPIESGEVHVAAERETLHHIGDFMKMAMYSFPRYRAHRG